MSLIKIRNNSKAIKKFFFSELLPVSRSLAKEEKVFFPKEPNYSLDTYYTIRHKITMFPKDFEIRGCNSMSNFEEELYKMWKSQGNIELLALSKSLSRLAELLYKIEEQNEEISPFIYVMF